MEGSFIGVQGSFVIGASLPRAWTGETDREAKPKRTKLRFSRLTKSREENKGKKSGRRVRPEKLHL